VLVLLSGYSSGSGLYYSCLDHLAQHFHVLCVDVLGTGASERPPFAAASVEEGEAFFVKVHGDVCPAFTADDHTVKVRVSIVCAIL
jgi:pimeloyl-ACP methyl ester carboxylesterase